MNDNIELQSNEDLLTWAVQNITTWNDAYTHLRSDLCEYPCYSTGAWYKYKGMHWSDPTGGDNGYLPLSSEKFSTKTLQVITKQEWMNAFHKTRLHTKPQTTVVDEYSSSCKPLQGHIHANLMAEYAEVALTHPEPWKEFESKHKRGEDWCTMYDHPYWDIECEYRRKPTPPKTMNIGGIVVEACPLEKAPELDSPYYMLSDDHGRFCSDLEHWDGNEFDFDRLREGKLFSTRKECLAVAGALNKVYNNALIGWKAE